MGQIVGTFPSGLVGEQGMAVVAGELFVSDGGPFGLDRRIVVYDPATMSQVREFTLPFSGTLGGLGGDGAAATFSAAFSSGFTAAPESGGDLYAITLSAGEDVTLSTKTPFDHPAASLVNELDPRIVVFDPTGAIVASDNNSAPDGKNALVSFQATQSGIYTIQVLVESGKGEYVLGVNTPGPPKVTDVLVRGSTWSTEFLNHLAVANLGSGGMSIHTGSSAQFDAVPWTTVTQVILRFSEDVDIQKQDIQIVGVNVPIYGISGFSYESSGFEAIWTLTSSFADDKVLLDLDASSPSGVVDSDDGMLLDGEFTNGVDSLASAGDGTPGGDFRFRINFLPGDVNQNGAVTTADVSLTRSRVGSSMGEIAYYAIIDVTIPHAAAFCGSCSV